ncbi:MAG: OmpA family protein [Gammaproteobacteria bacterium]|nr:OmpA family protein [Gammaproteobacteria bacterium]
MRQRHRNLAGAALEELSASSEHDDVDKQWMLSYIDVFILIVTLFVVLLSATRMQQTARAAISEVAVPEPALLAHTAVTEETVTLNLGVDTSGLPQEAGLPIVVPSDGLTMAVDALGEPDPAVGNEPDWTARTDALLADVAGEEHVRARRAADFVELVIDDALLFGTAEVDLTQAGRELLERLAPTLSATSGTIFIEGHTDDQPIATERFPSNWELAAARANAVLHQLADRGIEPARLRSVAFADTAPVADNDSAEGRSRNRRVSLLIRMPEAGVPAVGIGQRSSRN